MTERVCYHDSAMGGVHCNGDPGGTRRKLRMQTYEFRFYCWDCYKEFGWAWQAAMELDTLTKVRQMGLCGFNEAWIGTCLNHSPCTKHQHLICGSCGEPATHTCSETGQFVCGVPLCQKCEHVTFPDGTNGGVGFNQEKLPEGVAKRHCRKVGV